MCKPLHHRATWSPDRDSRYSRRSGIVSGVDLVGWKFDYSWSSHLTTNKQRNEHGGYEQAPADECAKPPVFVAHERSGALTMLPCHDRSLVVTKETPTLIL